ncbi:ubiquitin-like autophagy protein Apg12-domain-containing protein [Cyathus striatus]|nr:ubiquitin-like autophagy protein Apg12-domain-containing protein [Cyathus striatus]
MGENIEEAMSALKSYKAKDATVKVVVLFKGVGNAPVLRQNMYQVTASNRFETVILFLRKKLGWSAQEPLYTYINSAFSPAPDDVVSSLFKAFGTEGHLIVNYSTTMAWG